MKKEQQKAQESNKITKPEEAATIPKKTQIEVILEKFRNYLEAEGKSKTTANGYVRDVAKYLSFVENELKGDVHLLTEDYVEAFRAAMVNSKYTVNTINTKLNSLLSYNRMCIDLKLINVINVDTSKYRVNPTMLAELRKNK